MLGIKVKKEVAPKKAEWFVRERLASLENKNAYKIPREEARIKDLIVFDPRIDSHGQINSDDISNFFHKVQPINENPVLFKSLETCDMSLVRFFQLNFQNIKGKALLQNTKTEQEATEIFLKNRSVSDKTRGLHGQKINCTKLLQITTMHSQNCQNIVIEISKL